MSKKFLRIISEALKSDGKTLRLTLLMFTGVACSAVLVSVLVAAKHVGLP